MAGVYHPASGRVEATGSMASMIAAGAGMDVEATGLQNIRKLGQMRLISNKAIDAASARSWSSRASATSSACR